MNALVLTLAIAAGAYETDQLTDRELPLEDAREPVNQHLNALFSRAIEDANTTTGCRADRETTHTALARAIARHTARPAWVLERGFFRAPGFTRYSAWVERQDDIEKRSWRKRTDLFGDVTLWESVILTAAGPSSTLRVDDVLLGTDKFDHFLNFGYRAWQVSNHGREPDRAAAFSVRTERSFFGMITSKTFSYGDIDANSDGYAWFRGLLDEASPFALDRAGCITQVRPFDWAEHADWRYDEALNPSLYTRLVQKRISRRIQREPDRYCRAWQALGGPEYDAHIDALLDRAHVPLPRRYDERTDPYGLDALCRPDAAAASHGVGPSD